MEETPLVWFSCGAASYCAAKMALVRFPKARLLYIDPGWEHPDNVRFLGEAQTFLGHPIETIRSLDFADPAEVFRKKRLLKSPHGAPCTTELKKAVRQQTETGLEVQVFGFHRGESHGATRLGEANQEQAHLFWFPLLEQGWDKQRCLYEVERDGLVLPVMYRLGFKNANCVGCVKGGKGYWKKVRRLFRERFEEMAVLEEEIGYTLFERPLRAMPWETIREEGGLMGECGVICTLPLFEDSPELPPKKNAREEGEGDV